MSWYEIKVYDNATMKYYGKESTFYLDYLERLRIVFIQLSVSAIASLIVVSLDSYDLTLQFGPQEFLILTILIVSNQL